MWKASRVLPGTTVKSPDGIKGRWPNFAAGRSTAGFRDGSGDKRFRVHGSGFTVHHLKVASGSTVQRFYGSTVQRFIPLRGTSGSRFKVKFAPLLTILSSRGA